LTAFGENCSQIMAGAGKRPRRCLPPARRARRTFVGRGNVEILPGQGLGRADALHLICSPPSLLCRGDTPYLPTCSCSSYNGRHTPSRSRTPSHVSLRLGVSPILVDMYAMLRRKYVQGQAAIQDPQCQTSRLLSSSGRILSSPPFNFSDCTALFLEER